MEEKKYSVNTLEKHVIEKYGTVSKFISKWQELQEISDIEIKGEAATTQTKYEHEREKIENIIRKPDFLNKMRLAMEICDGLRIDFAELFYNENIKPATVLNVKEAAEERFSLLSSAARRKAIEYMDDILEIKNNN